MYKFLKLAILVAAGLAAFPAAGQETPQVEISGAYSYVRANLITANGCCFNMNGGSGSAAFNLNHWFGLVGEFGGYTQGNVESTGANLNVITYLFGPQFSYRKNDRWTPFAHALFGAGHAGGTLYTGIGGAPGLGPNSAFAMVAGGGLDLKVSPRVAVRLFDVDYMYTQFRNSTNNRQNQLRVSVGIVLRFGER
jgi:hypothetical protein